MAETTTQAARGTAVAATRTLHLVNPLLTGPDVAALQELLAPYHPGEVDGEFGPATAAAVKRAKWALGYPDSHCDGSSAALLVGYLQGQPLPPEYEARRDERAQAAAASSTLRDRIVDNVRWAIANEP